MTAKLQQHMKAIAEERDKLDNFIAEALRGSCDRAYEELWMARDALSELV